MLDTRLVIVSGKGGVGKSAVAAAIAHASALRGKQTLVLSMTGSGMGLGAHLGSTHLEFKPMQVQPNLWALAMDRSRALTEYLQIQLRLPSYATFTPSLRAFDALASTAPAVREIVTMGKVLWEVNTERWDLVVADGPPTGQIGSFLYAPTAINELVKDGRLARQATWMRRTLREVTTTALALVTIPEELPTTETQEMLAWLAENHVVSTPTVIANRVLDPLTATDEPTGPTGAAARLHRSLCSEQQQWLAALPADIRLPFQFGASDPQVVANEMSTRIQETLL